jgi:hypothetical protein
MTRKGISFSGIDLNATALKSQEELEEIEKQRKEQAEAFRSHEKEMRRLNRWKNRPLNREE